MAGGVQGDVDQFAQAVVWAVWLVLVVATYEPSTVGAIVVVWVAVDAADSRWAQNVEHRDVVACGAG